MAVRRAPGGSGRSARGRGQGSGAGGAARTAFIWIELGATKARTATRLRKVSPMSFCCSTCATSLSANERPLATPHDAQKAHSVPPSPPSAAGAHASKTPPPGVPAACEDGGGWGVNSGEVR